MGAESPPTRRLGDTRLYDNSPASQTVLQEGNETVSNWSCNRERVEEVSAESFVLLSRPNSGIFLEHFSQSKARQFVLCTRTQGTLNTQVAEGGIAYLEGMPAGLAVGCIHENVICSPDDHEGIQKQSARAPPF